MFSVDPTAGKLVLLPSSSMEGSWRLLFWLLGSGKAGKGGQTNPDCLWNQYSDIPSPTLKQGTGKQSTRTIFKIGMGTGKDSLMHLAGLIAGGQGHKGRSLLCGSVRSLASLECWQAKEYTFQTKSLWQKSAVKLSAWEGRRDRQKTQAMWPTEIWHALSCRFRPDYLVHVCIGSIGCIDASCTHFFFLKTSWPLQQILLQVIWQQSSPKTSTKLPCLLCLWSSPQIGSLCPWTRRSLEGFSQDWFQNTSCTGRKERRKRFEWNTPKSQQVSFGRLHHYSRRFCVLTCSEIDSKGNFEACSCCALHVSWSSLFLPVSFRSSYTMELWNH